MKEVIIIGGGGHAVSILELLNQNNISITGFIDPNENAVISEFGVKCLGNEDNLKELLKFNQHCIIGIGQIKTADKRIHIVEKLSSLSASFPIIKSKKSTVSENSRVGSGTVVFNNAVVNFGALLGSFNIINTSAIIEHGATTEDFVHIAPGAIVLGDCFISEGTFIGAGTVIREGVKIGKNCIIGAGLVIKHNVCDGTIIK